MLTTRKGALLSNMWSPCFRKFSGINRRANKGLTVLGIESSCDDSCVAVVRYSDRSILADERISQFGVHQTYGGIVPILAVREHEKNLPLVLASAMKRIEIADKESIDLVAVTVGPGLKACLRTGMNLAIEVGKQLNVSVIGVNHLEGHALVPRIDNDQIRFPFMTLLVSGGHSCLSIANGPGDHMELGSTLDDAMGEAFDKVIRSLNHPEASARHGGAVLEALAKHGNPDSGLKLPIALRGPTHKRPRGFDFSFSGLKSSTSRTIARNEYASEDIALAFQHAAVEHATYVVSHALESFPHVRQLVVCGGVASNEYLRSRLRTTGVKHKVEVFFPPNKLCVDNGVMIAWCGAERWMAAKTEDERKSMLISSTMHPKARWPLGDLRTDQTLHRP